MPTDAYEDATEQRIAALGIRNPRCPCGEANPFALTGAHPGIVCYECQAAGGGRSIIEGQHVQGRANGPQTVPMLGNDHRVADSHKTVDWPTETLRNPDGSPLLKAAACIRGWLDLLAVVIERTVGWVPPFLENLHHWLIDRLGPRWWDNLDFDLGLGLGAT